MRDRFVWQVECAGLPGVVRHCRRCGVTPAPPKLAINGAPPPPGSHAAIALVPAYPLPVRAEAVLRAGLGLRLSALERLSAQGSLRAAEGDIMRIKLSAIVHVEIDLP